MELNKAMGICLKNHIKVYPVGDKPYFYIEASIRNKPKRFNKKLLTPKDVNKALAKTYIYYAEKLEINK